MLPTELPTRPLCGELTTAALPCTTHPQGASCTRCAHHVGISGRLPRAAGCVDTLLCAGRRGAAQRRCAALCGAALHCAALCCATLCDAVHALTMEKWRWGAQLRHWPACSQCCSPQHTPVPHSTAAQWATSTSYRSWAWEWRGRPLPQRERRCGAGMLALELQPCLVLHTCCKPAAHGGRCPVGSPLSLDCLLF